MSRRERKEADRQDKRREKKKRARNKEFARVTYIFVTLFIAMMGYISYFNVVKSRDIISSPYNKRQDSYADRVIRGRFWTEMEMCWLRQMWQKMGQRQENIRTIIYLRMWSVILLRENLVWSLFLTLNF